MSTDDKNQNSSYTALLVYPYIVGFVAGEDAETKNCLTWMLGGSVLEPSLMLLSNYSQLQTHSNPAESVA